VVQPRNKLLMYTHDMQLTWSLSKSLRSIEAVPHFNIIPTHASGLLPQEWLHHVQDITHWRSCAMNAAVDQPLRAGSEDDDSFRNIFDLNDSIGIQDYAISCVYIVIQEVYEASRGMGRLYFNDFVTHVATAKPTWSQLIADEQRARLLYVALRHLSSEAIHGTVLAYLGSTLAQLEIDLDIEPQSEDDDLP
jgi:hypothetical protein